MKKPSEILSEEHQVILKMLDIVERACKQLEYEKKIEIADIRNMIDFIRTFADHCHHKKEEELLFKMMLERGLPSEGGPIQVMLSEHDLGRNYVKQAEEAINTLEKAYSDDAAQQFIQNAMGYVMLLREHIYKEDNILYPMGDRLFSDDDQTNLLKAFNKVEHEDIGHDVHEKYIRLVEELSQKYPE
ncbi:MAG: hemerythrin domain-containing protein [Calditrichia bacterium]